MWQMATGTITKMRMNLKDDNKKVLKKKKSLKKSKK